MANYPEDFGDPLPALFIGGEGLIFFSAGEIDTDTGKRVVVDFGWLDNPAEDIGPIEQSTPRFDNELPKARFAFEDIATAKTFFATIAGQFEDRENERV